MQNFIQKFRQSSIILFSGNQVFYLKFENFDELQLLYSSTGPGKWISKWGRLWNTESIVGHQDWPTRKIFEF